MFTFSFFVIISLFINYGSKVEGVLTATASPSSVALNENDDAGRTLSTISCNRACYCSASGTVSGLISYNDAAKTVVKATCSATSCGSCTSCSACQTSSGCLTASASYTVTVSCTDSSNSSFTDSTSVSISVAAETPTLTISLPASASADNSMSSGNVIATASQSSGPSIVEYVKQSSVASSYSIGTSNLFDLNTGNGNIFVNGDPSDEYDYTYSMTVCIESRRQSSCQAITINFDGCFETPNCDDQSDTTLSDQFTVGDTLFTMTYDNPSAHFASISSTWQNLRFSELSSTLSVASLDSTTGMTSSDIDGLEREGRVIKTTGNVTVWPDYPYSYHTIVVTATNTGYSCSYTSTCTMSMQFSFTNWPISLESLPGSSSIHEDTDARTLVHSIVTYDYNNKEHDNVTCIETYNENDTLLYLDHNGNYSYDSWGIYKHPCSDPGCGFICSANGCMNYDLDNEFVITIRCSDAYGSFDEADFTLRITENQPPVWTNVPTTKTLNSDQVSHLDILFSIYYTDAEGETLAYNYSIVPDQPTLPLFEFDPTGNYHNSPANITALKFFWDQLNSSYALDFCGTERRNMVCSDLTLEVQEYCGPTPSCNDDAVTVTDQFSIGGELLVIDLNDAPAGLSYTNINYVVISATSGLFTVDPTTGSVTAAGSLAVNNPPNTQTHVLKANVYDTEACEYGACTLTITVNFTNFDISITNMDNVLVVLHEDHETEVTLHTILTSDASAVDDVTCYLDTANSVPDTDIFTVEETDYGSNVYQIISRELPGFDYAVSSQYLIVVICEDNYGSTVSGNMTVNITENQQPTIDNLASGDLIVVDPMTYFYGAVIFTLDTSDVEGDHLDYSCSVDNSFVPLECLTDGVVSLRRNVRVPDEDGEIYNITMCINEPIHNHTLCETLSVNFTSSKTNPVIDNLPASVDIAENATVGSFIFNVTVDDPDIGDIHIFTMTAYPAGTTEFTFDRNEGVLTLKRELDYETENSYSFVISVKDTYLPGLEEKILTVNVTDVNEVPTLQLTQTTFNTHEENATFQIATIPYTCTDPDFGQNMTLTITAGTYASYFMLNDSSILSFAQDWDFEAAGSLPSSTSLELTCDDGNGLDDVANIVINIDRVNEFAPVLNTEAENITIYNNQTLLASLLTVTATDDDHGHDGIFGFQIVGDGQGVRYFTMRGSGDTSDLFIKNYINWNYNYTFVLNIEVSDLENEALTSSVYVTVTYIAPELEIPTKEPKRCLLCTSIGVALGATLSVEGFLILCIFCHASKRMRIWEICKLKPKPRRTEDISRRRRGTKSLQDDSYRPGSEMLFRALPKEKPPSKVFYKEPVTPPAAKYYDPPNSAIKHLTNVPDPTQPRADSDIRHNAVTPTNVTFFHPIDDFNVRSKDGLVPPLPKTRRRRGPSLFQDPSNAPPGVNDQAGFYIPDKDPYNPSLNRTEEHNDEYFDAMPMFGRPDPRALYGEYSHPLPATKVDNSLDF